MAGPCVQILSRVLQRHASPNLHAPWVVQQSQVRSSPAANHLKSIIHIKNCHASLMGSWGMGTGVVSLLCEAGAANLCSPAQQRWVLCT